MKSLLRTNSRPVRLSSVVVRVLVVAVVGFGLGKAGQVGAQTLGIFPEPPATPAPVEEESPEMAPVGSAAEIGAGSTSGGDTWKAVTYKTVGGYVCVDIRTTGPSTDGRTQMVGSCFEPDASFTGTSTVPLSGGVIAYGVLEKSATVNAPRAVTVSYANEPANVTTTTAAGVFVSSGSAAPATLTHVSSLGGEWTYGFTAGQP